MNAAPAKITLGQWEQRYAQLKAAGLVERACGGRLGRHVEDGDLRLEVLRFDNSPAALGLWNFLLSEEDRLRQARASGRKLVGAMKDLGTIPVMAYALPELVAFYPDGAWWIPCVMQMSEGLLGVADSLGVNESFCPVRAMLGAFLTGAHFPIPDLLTCSVGAVCDDFSAIAQRLEAMGFAIKWWEVPLRRQGEPGEQAVRLPGGCVAPTSQVAFVRNQLGQIRDALSQLAGRPLTDELLCEGIAAANRVRSLLRRLRELAFTAPLAPLPALEMLIAEMLAIHFCSDRAECIVVLEDLLAQAQQRADAGVGALPAEAVPVFWVNPVADLAVMNLLEDLGGRVCGTDYMFAHALDEIPTDVPPMEALARMALADPMVGPAAQRAQRIGDDVRRLGARGVVISRIPGASHCSHEGAVMAEHLRRLGVPTVEIEVPPVSDSVRGGIRTRLEALLELARRGARGGDMGEGLGETR